MKALITSLILIVSWACAAQDSTMKALIGGGFAVQRSALRFDDAVSEFSTMSALNNDRFIPGSGVGFSVRTDLNIKNNYWLSTGIGWDVLRFRTDSLEQIGVAGIQYRLSSISLPALINYHFYHRKNVSFYTGAGIRFQLVTSIQSNYQLIGKNDAVEWEKVSDFEQFIFSACVNAGARWKLHEGWYAEMGVNYIQGVNDVLSSSMRARVQQVSAFVGLLRKF